MCYVDISISCVVSAADSITADYFFTDINEMIIAPNVKENRLNDVLLS